MGSCSYPSMNLNIKPGPYSHYLQSSSPSWSRVPYSSAVGDRPRLPALTSSTNFFAQGNHNGGGDRASAPQCNVNCLKLPPIKPAGQLCNNHPRNDCCRVPTMPSAAPRNFSECDPTANWVEMTPHVKSNQEYKPPSVPWEGNSLYRSHFRGCFSPAADSCKPNDSYQGSDGRMDGRSLYKDDFPWKTSDTVRYQRKEEYIPSVTPFRDASTYRQDYRGCFTAPAESCKPDGRSTDGNGKFDGTSHYQTEFIPYCSAEYNYAKGASTKPTDSGGGFSCQPFNGSSTYRMDFVPKFQGKTPSAKPHDYPAFPEVPFSGRTSYRQDYIPFYYKKNCQDRLNECFRPCR